MNQTTSSFSLARGIRVFAIAPVMLLAGVIAHPASAQQPTLQSAPERISQQAIHADHGAYEATQNRIRALNDRAIEVDNYQLAKAQCWLDTSFHEYTRNDRGGYPQAALDEAVRIIGALESDQQPGMQTPLVNNADKLRVDLWQKFDSLKQATGFSCAAQATACAEVELVHAGNEIHDGGWRHANPYIQIAEDLVSKAEQQAADCAPPEAQVERFDLEADALFKFNGASNSDILEKGKRQIEELVAQLGQVYLSIERVEVVGHTDRLGSSQYNQRLSEQRAETVKQFMQAAGFSAPINASGRGESMPTAATAGCKGERASAALVKCLQPDRRVSIEVTGTRK
ncbi:OmpA family protein [Pseudoxanthomonas dokdonensis]|uniref:OmpA-like domain-containing protein n=1 Tax=Pseudoxanthomonas dokdonensis TaxID=344882 RepID=A0A0R0CGN8_9GAMM|nr:OmpA family protein [Pseudoxanthomonas dokdonensis]KRG68507.1 hypothetical protein ABB29_12885 [Pseudoxanthomonas dokdonensis]